jgi:hypothetical protein
MLTQFLGKSAWIIEIQILSLSVSNETNLFLMFFVVVDLFWHTVQYEIIKSNLTLVENLLIWILQSIYTLFDHWLNTLHSNYFILYHQASLLLVALFSHDLK